MPRTDPQSLMRATGDPRAREAIVTRYRALHASSLDATTRSEDGDAPSLLDPLGSTGDGYGSALDRSAVETLLGALDERDRAIVELYFREELTQSQIGERLGYSQMHISRLLRRALGELERAAA